MLLTDYCYTGTLAIALSFDWLFNVKLISSLLTVSDL